MVAACDCSYIFVVTLRCYCGFLFVHVRPPRLFSACLCSVLVGVVLCFVCWGVLLGGGGGGGLFFVK